jgi:hypothetical protein
MELVDRISFGNDQLSLFQPVTLVPEHLSTVEQDLKNLDIMNLTPMQALLKLQDLKSLIPNV